MNPGTIGDARKRLEGEFVQVGVLLRLGQRIGDSMVRDRDEDWLPLRTTAPRGSLKKREPRSRK